MYHDIKSDFLSKPFYLYKLENGLHNKHYLAKYDKDADYSNLDKLVDVFQIMDEDHPLNKSKKGHRMELSQVKDIDVKRNATCDICGVKLLRHEEFYHIAEGQGKDIIHEDYHRMCIEVDVDGESSDEENQTYNEL
jgi:hypothetical protein